MRKDWINRWIILCSTLLPLVLGGCGPLTFVVNVGPSQQKLESTVVEDDGQMFSDRVAIVDVQGLIYNTGKPSLMGEGENPVSLLQEKLDKARTDPRVKAIILRLNTPGGTVTASDMMYREVRRFRDKTHKPVICLMMDITASGGYYLACSADRIVAYPTTVTGSIGVIVQTLSVKPALSRIGVEAEAITSGPNKETGSPLSVLTEGQRKVLRKLVDDFYARFTGIVRESRPTIPADDFAMATDGRVFSGEDALRYGLVDELGDLHDAFEDAKRATGLSHADLVLYHRPMQYVGSPYATAQAPVTGTQINFAQINFTEDGMSPLGFAGAPIGIYYLWQPTLP